MNKPPLEGNSLYKYLILGYSSYTEAYNWWWWWWWNNNDVLIFK